VALGDLAPIQTSRPPPAESPPPRAGAEVIEAVLALDLPLVRARERVVEEFERRYVQRVLAQHGGNVTNAAAASGIARRYFQLLRARHGA
jgi:DNA-binding NtrC family response regulator